MKNEDVFLTLWKKKTTKNSVLKIWESHINLYDQKESETGKSWEVRHKGPLCDHEVLEKICTWFNFETGLCGAHCEYI